MEQPEEGYIHIKNAEANNLKGIDVDIPRNRLTVITGVSGSGKTSLAFDTLFAEGQRRFAESLSSFARQFLGRMSKPPVESISGIPPAIAIEQRVNTRNPRSTVGSTTEIYDYLRVLFAKIGRTYSPVTGEEVRCDTVASVMERLHSLAASLPAGDPSDEEYSPGICFILADIHWEEEACRVERLLNLKEEGFSRLYILPSGDNAGRMEKIDSLLADIAPGRHKPRRGTGGSPDGGPYPLRQQHICGRGDGEQDNGLRAHGIRQGSGAHRLRILPRRGRTRPAAVLLPLRG